MTGPDVVSGASIAITVELFGAARLKAGVSAVSLSVEPGATTSELARTLAHECPALVGNALSDDGLIADGYALNRNGLEFLPADVASHLDLQAGDTILLLSNQAGG